MDQSHDQLRVLVACYVIGAISADEASSVRAHILTCDDCLVEAESLSSVTASLDLMAATEEPPEGFAERVMARVADQRVSTTAPRGVGAGPFASLWGRVAGGALAACVALLGFLLWDARSDLARQQEAVAALAGTEEGMVLRGEGAARMVPTAGGAIFAAAELAAVPEGKTYQLWLMRGDCGRILSPACERVSFGTFGVTDGVAVLETSSAAGFERAAVTVEPEGGSSQPTGPIVVKSA